MKKVAIVTAAVLALGLAACNKNDADNNTANDTAVENTASTDVNAATNDSVNAADAALNATDNSVANASNALDSANATAANATENK
jgi:outer membrane lipoprotein SlyB